MALIESSAPGRPRGFFGRLKDYMLAPPRDPNAIIGEDGEPLPDLVPDSGSPTGYRELAAPRSCSLPKTRLANFAGRFGAVGGIIPTHGAGGAQQFFTGLTGSLQANQNRDMMLAQQARADKQQWLQQQQAVSDAANQYQKNQLAEERARIQEERDKRDFEQRQKSNAALIAMQEANAADKRQETARKYATQTRALEPGDAPQRAPGFGMIPGGLVDLGLAMDNGSIFAPQGGGAPRRWMSDEQIKARDKLATEKAQRRYPMPKALADQFAPGTWTDEDRFTDEELQHLHAYAQSDNTKPQILDRLGGAWAVTKDPKTGKLIGQRIENVPGKDPREFAPQRDRVEIAITPDGKAVIVNKDAKTVEALPGGDNLTRMGGPGKGKTDLSKYFTKKDGGGGGAAAPPIPSTLTQANVGKVYTDKNGKRRKILQVNPKNPAQALTQLVD